MSRSYKRNDPHAIKSEFGKEVIERKGKSKGSSRGKVEHNKPIEINDVMFYPSYDNEVSMSMAM